MVEESDIQQMILSELREIKGEVRHIPRLQAQVDSMRGATNQLETAMRETTSALQMQATAHSKLLDELRLQVHQTTAAMMGLSNDVQALMTRVKDVEKQTSASFQQQLQLARDVRDASCFPDPEEYKSLKVEVDTLPTLREDVQGVKGELAVHRPWLMGIEWFLRILFYALALVGVAGLLWLLGQGLVNAL